MARETWKKRDPMTATCPTCQAKPGEVCSPVRGKSMRTPTHQMRRYSVEVK